MPVDAMAMDRKVGWRRGSRVLWGVGEEVAGVRISHSVCVEET